MLTRAQEKLIRSLRTGKERRRSGLCLIEGEKLVREAKPFLLFRFGREDTPRFDELVSTETPQPIAAVARLPEWSLTDAEKKRTMVVLDGVQDPGNVGSIMRLCLGFDASLLLVDSADVTAPKVVRASAGALFRLPWIRMDRGEAEGYLGNCGRTLYRLERRRGSRPVRMLSRHGPAVLIAGSEGRGITLGCRGESVAIEHDSRLESLNVGQALAIALHARYRH